MVVRRGYGNECSLMWATRAPGYHTTPHAHEAEQINYVLEGEIWFFVEEHGFLCKAGDFQRIPGAQNSLGMEPLRLRCRRGRGPRSRARCRETAADVDRPISMKAKHRRCGRRAKIILSPTIGRAWNARSLASCVLSLPVSSCTLRPVCHRLESEVEISSLARANRNKRYSQRSCKSLMIREKAIMSGLSRLSGFTSSR